MPPGDTGESNGHGGPPPEEPPDGDGPGPLVGPVRGGLEGGSLDAPPGPALGELPPQDPDEGPLVIDGSLGEGGGQVFRTAIGMAAALGVDVVITNIRAGRPRPGLSFQHLAALDAVERLCGARVTGKSVGSMEVGFYPGGLRGGNYELDVGTAGAVTLVLQAVLIAAAQGGDTFTLRLTGGTDVKWSPPVDHFIYVTVPLLELTDMAVTVRLVQRGYYPKGGGRLEVTIDPPRKPRPILLGNRGPLKAVHGIAHASRLPGHIPNRMAEAARERLEQVLWGMEEYKHIEPRVGVIEGGPAMDRGTGISLWMIYDTETRLYGEGPAGPSGEGGGGGRGAGASGGGGRSTADAPVQFLDHGPMSAGDGEPAGAPWLSAEQSVLKEMTAGEGLWQGEGRLGVNALGEKGVAAERVGESAADELLGYLRTAATVDTHTADQLIPFVAMFGGEFIARGLSEHARTNLGVVDRFMPGRVQVEEVGEHHKVFARGVWDPNVAGLLEAGDESGAEPP